MAKIFSDRLATKTQLNACCCKGFVQANDYFVLFGLGGVAVAEVARKVRGSEKGRKLDFEDHVSTKQAVPLTMPVSKYHNHLPHFTRQGGMAMDHVRTLFAAFLATGTGKSGHAWLAPTSLTSSDRERLVQMACSDLCSKWLQPELTASAEQACGATSSSKERRNWRMKTARSFFQWLPDGDQNSVSLAAAAIRTGVLTAAAATLLGRPASHAHPDPTPIPCPPLSAPSSTTSLPSRPGAPMKGFLGLSLKNL